MTHRTKVTQINNRYGKFIHWRYTDRETFEDYVRHKLKRGNKKSRTITSKNVVEWRPTEDSPPYRISLGVWGEMQALFDKPVPSVINDKLHALMVTESTNDGRTC